MFDDLSDRLGGVFDNLKKRGALKEEDVIAAMREVRVALLEADVALPVVKDFIEAVSQKAIGQDVLRSVTPGQMVIKIVHNHLIEILGSAEGGEQSTINLTGNPPVAVMMVGLQGSGKTTTTAKLGRYLTNREKKKILMASLDIYRPAAQQQLIVLGEQTDIKTLTPVMGEMPVAIAKRAMDTGRKEGFDVVLLDTAGRVHLDEEMMAEVAAVHAAVSPTEVLLVADALTGQDAVTIAKAFHEKAGVTGIVLTRVDGDSRGGAALSMRAVTGCPIKFLGVGEKVEDFEAFQAERLAGRILGMGDMVGLIEKATDVVDQEEAEKLAKKMLKGQFTLEDMAEQLKQIRKMGDMEGLMAMMPGIKKVKKQIAAQQIDDNMIKHQEAIILSMTPTERRNATIIKASRRKRIAAGSGTSVQEVNKVLKQHKQMSAMMKKVGKMGAKGLMSGMSGGMPGGLPPGMMPPQIR